MLHRLRLFTHLPLLLTICLALAASAGDSSPEADASRFALGAALLPGLAALSGGVLQRTRLLWGVSAGLLWVGAYRAFVSYQNHPWLAGPETLTCDGPCFGWYTFEFSPPYLVLAVICGFSAAVGVAVGRLRGTSTIDRSAPRQATLR
ncbi:MAG: hypothetical protein ACI8S6_001526 [Myxococcota bacterium]|jgi:hypothetical protein